MESYNKLAEVLADAGNARTTQPSQFDEPTAVAPSIELGVQRGFCERNPRLGSLFGYKPAKPATDGALCPQLAPVSRAYCHFVLLPWGFARKASLHPGLYSSACFAGSLPATNPDRIILAKANKKIKKFTQRKTHIDADIEGSL